MKETNLCNGSNGFIGSELTRTLKHAGETVIAGDRVGNCPEEVTRIFDLASFGNLFHQTDVKEIYQANLYRVLRLLHQSEDVYYKSMVLVSSSSVLLPHQTYYSLSKKAMEELATKWASDHEQPIVIVRPTTVIGVGEQPSHLIPKLIDSCLNGTEMPFIGDPTHDFLDVRDFVSGMIYVSKRASDLPGYTFNIGSGESIPNWAIKSLVEEYTGKKANTKEIENMRPYDTREWKVDTSDIRLLGWSPKYTLKETIKNMVDKYDQS